MMTKLLKIAPVFAILFGFESAHAVPSFARQTGLSCNVCHTNAPELTAFGRDFKLHGYVSNEKRAGDRVGDTPELQLSRNIPISFFILLSDTSFQNVAPSTQNSAAGFPQQLSLFLAGGWASHFGGLAQVTYTHTGDHFSMDNTDLRYANQTKLGSKQMDYGVTLNNNPGVEDLWNTNPVWGFPYISSGAKVSPIAAPLIAGALGQDVAGLGVYSLWDRHLYAAFSLYRSEHGGGPAPLDGANYAYNITGAAPYWRAGWQQDFGNNYLFVGTSGLAVNSHPGVLTGPVDRYRDPSLDFQYERPFGVDFLDVHGTWIHESSRLNATYAAGAANTLTHHLNTFKVDTTYHFTNKYTASGALFKTTGGSDSLLYAPAPLTGSLNGNPGNSGYIVQFAYWPVQNIDLNVNYTGYTRFNGAGTNYDGAQRNASDNNSVYAALWVNF